MENIIRGYSIIHTIFLILIKIDFFLKKKKFARRQVEICISKDVGISSILAIISESIKKKSFLIEESFHTIKS